MRWYALLIAVAGFGCRTASVYEVAYHDAARVQVETSDALGASATLADSAPGSRAQLVVEPPRLGPLSGGGYRAATLRATGGAIDLVFTSAGEHAERATLVRADGTVAIDFPVATGDMLDFPGFHLAGVTAVGGPPMTMSEGVHRLRFTYRPSYETQQAMGWSPDVRIALRTDRANLRSVVRYERSSPGHAFLAGTGLVIAASGAAFLLSDLGGEGGRGFRIGIGLPLLVAGSSAGGWGLWSWLKPEQRTEIPLDDAFGAP